MLMPDLRTSGSAFFRELERFQAKWIPVCVKKPRKENAFAMPPGSALAF
jgi:hypothetical protein